MSSAENTSFHVSMELTRTFQKKDTRTSWGLSSVVVPSCLFLRWSTIFAWSANVLGCRLVLSTFGPSWLAFFRRLVHAQGSGALDKMVVECVRSPVQSSQVAACTRHTTERLNGLRLIPTNRTVCDTPAHVGNSQLRLNSGQVFELRLGFKLRLGPNGLLPYLDCRKIAKTKPRNLPLKPN